MLDLLAELLVSPSLPENKIQLNKNQVVNSCLLSDAALQVSNSALYDDIHTDVPHL